VNVDLSDRELEILELIAEGYTNTEIADKTFTSRRTVETHRKNLIEKTKTKNTATLIKYAIVNGLLK
jgi:DNA-binding NarL/FixJ family response regulator